MDEAGREVEGEGGRGGVLIAPALLLASVVVYPSPLHSLLVSCVPGRAFRLLALRRLSLRFRAM